MSTKLSLVIKTFLICLLTINLSFCETLLEKVNRNLELQGVESPSLNVLELGWYKVNQGAIDHFVVYANSLNKIDVKDLEPKRPGFFDSREFGFICGVVTAKLIYDSAK